MQSPEHPLIPPRRRPLLLIHNLFNYGHFLVYADTLTRWALSRGFRVLFLGRGLDGTHYQRLYQGAQHVEIRDLKPGAHLDQERAAQTKIELAAQALQDILAAQRELAPQASILLSTDELLFNAREILEPDFAFPAPTVGVVTFGHRDRYLGHKDLYARNLDRVLAARRPFAAVLTLDEYQVAALDPAEEHLVFLPDIYADPPGSARADGGADDGSDGGALREFLAGGDGPVLPLLGKLDQRKNVLWTLGLARQTPGACCVMLGERVPCDDAALDPAIDALLAELSAQGRAFVRLGYVSEALFRQTLAHARTRFLPLPYSCHYGSSGLQLQAFAAGKPTLVPDVGLMARRVRAHGLGLCYAHGDREDFLRTGARLLALDPRHFSEGLSRFMDCFTPEQRDAQLDRAFGLPRPAGQDSGAAAQPTSLARLVAPVQTGCQSADPAEAVAWLLDQALDLHHAGRTAEALEPIERALERRPESGAAQFRKALMLASLGRAEQLTETLDRALANGGAEEFEFVLRTQLDIVEALLEGADPQRALAHSAEALLLADAALRPTPQTPGGPGWPPRFTAVVWRRIGVVLARTGWHEAAVQAFGKALVLAPEEHDCRLNLSDVLRTQLDIIEALLEGADPQHALAHSAETLPLADAALRPMPRATKPGLSPLPAAMVWRRIGVVLARTGWHEAAVQAFGKALVLAPEEHDCRLNLSDVLRYAGRLDEADAALDELARHAPEHHGLHHKRGQVLFERGRFAEALAQFKREPADSEHHGPARSYLERIAARQRDKA